MENIPEFGSTPGIDAIKNQTLQGIFGKNYKVSKEEKQEIEREKNMEIGENFMNELYKLAKDFTPLYKEGEKVVYFDVEEKNGVLQKIEFWDKRKDYTGKEKTSQPDGYSLAGVSMLRGTDGSFFSLSTYGPMYRTVSAGSGHVNHSRSNFRTTSTLGFSGLYKEEAYDIPSLLEVIKKRVAEAKGEVYISEKSRVTADALADALSQDHDKKTVKKRKTKK